MKNRLMVFTALLVVWAAPLGLRAQTAASTGSKVGLINIQAAIANTEEGKKALADLQAKYQPRQKDLQGEQQQIQAIQDQLSKQANTLSDEEQARLNRESEEKQKQLKRDMEDAQNDFSQDRDEAINRIGKKMVQVINNYAQQNGFSLVIDDAQIPIYFAAKDLDITAEIVKRYDAANPVAGMMPAKPAAAAPAAPKPKQ